MYKYFVYVSTGKMPPNIERIEYRARWTLALSTTGGGFWFLFSCHGVATFAQIALCVRTFSMDVTDVRDPRPGY